MAGLYMSTPGYPMKDFNKYFDEDAPADMKNLSKDSKKMTKKQREAFDAREAAKSGSAHTPLTSRYA